MAKSSLPPKKSGPRITLKGLDFRTHLFMCTIYLFLSAYLCTSGYILYFWCNFFYFSPDEEPQAWIDTSTIRIDISTLKILNIYTLDFSGFRIREFQTDLTAEKNMNKQIFNDSKSQDLWRVFSFPTQDLLTMTNNENWNKHSSAFPILRNTVSFIIRVNLRRSVIIN